MRKNLLGLMLFLLMFGLPVHRAFAADDSQPGLLPLPPKAADIQQAIWVLVIFIVLAIVLYRTAWKNVLAGLKGREDRIRKDIADAEASRLKAESNLRDYTKQLADAEAKVRDIMAKAGIDAERVAQSIRMQAQNDSEEIKERATREIEAAREQAVREVYEQGATLATTVAEKILRRSINADDQRDLVERALSQMQELHN